ncbi:MAG: methyltransferase domain-containing protein [Ktedonobacteraceae bacterium]|nr:methyltransferase domain-containing protein [Ktedonobacteraceae bacterium]
MHTIFMDLLECPRCHGALTWDIMEQRGGQIEEAETSCKACGATYPVHQGIALFLLADLPRNDFWEQSESGISSYLREHADVEQQLMEGPVDLLTPADQFLRGMVLDDRGAYNEARRLTNLALPHLYTPAYQSCLQSEIQQLASMLFPTSWPLVDLASGRGTLIETLLQRVDQPIIISDFSPTILHRLRRQQESFGLADRMTLLAFDARRTPFKQGAVQTMTTLLGLSNIEQPGQLLHELRRILSGPLLAIVHFFPEDDEANVAAIRANMDSPFLFRRSALEQFTNAGWQVELVNVQTGQAHPTPPSVVFPGLQLDGLPVAETTLEWGLLVAR